MSFRRGTYISSIFEKIHIFQLFFFFTIYQVYELESLKHIFNLPKWGNGVIFQTEHPVC